MCANLTLWRPCDAIFPIPPASATDNNLSLKSRCHFVLSKEAHDVTKYSVSPKKDDLHSEHKEKKYAA